MLQTTTVEFQGKQTEVQFEDYVGLSTKLKIVDDVLQGLMIEYNVTYDYEPDNIPRNEDGTYLSDTKNFKRNTGVKRYNSLLREYLFDKALVDNLSSFSLVYRDNNGNVVPSENPIFDLEIISSMTLPMEIKQAIGADLIVELNKAIDDNIQYITGVNPNSLESVLAKGLDGLFEKFNELDFASFADLSKKISSMKDEFTTDKFIDAYTNSDLFKREVEKEKATLRQQNENVINFASNVEEKVEKPKTKRGRKPAKTQDVKKDNKEE